VPLLIAGYVLAERRRRRESERFSSAAMRPNVVSRAPGFRRHLPVALFLAALAAMLVGLARPHAALSVPREEATVMLAMDVSRSMVATDVRPTRLAAAQAAVKRFLERLPEKYRVGVIAFSNTAEVVSPPTQDRAIVRAAIDALRPASGTAIGDAIKRSLDAARIGPALPGRRATLPPTSILLLSDGAQTQGNLRPQAAALLARREGVRVHTVALGTSDAVVEVPRPGGLRERVTVPPDPQTLRAVASTTGGRFFPAPSAARLDAVYQELASRLGSEKKDREITVAFAGGSLVLLLVGAILSIVWFRRLP
jgi:Ca-activated chloride channel family protein